MIPEYNSGWAVQGTQSSPYYINSSNQLYNGISFGGQKSGGESGQIYSSYTYLLVAKSSHIETVRSFFAAVNRLTSYNGESYYTDKFYVDHTITEADGVMLNPDYPEKYGNYDYYLANGYITGGGQILYIFFNMPGSLSDKRYFPVLYLDIDEDEEEKKPKYWIQGAGNATTTGSLQSQINTLIKNTSLLTNNRIIIPVLFTLTFLAFSHFSST
jgi:hypothetical protein